MIVRLSITSMTAGLLLASCTDPNLDACGNANRAVTLGNMAGNVASGSLDQCITDLQQELDALRLEGRVLQAEESRLRTLSSSLSGERQAAAARLASLNATQADLVNQIAREGRGANEASLARVLTEERNLRRDIATAGDGVDQRSSEALAQRQRDLNALALDLI